MAKKKGGKSKGYISAGRHNNVSSKTLKAMRRGESVGDKMINKFKAWKKGKPVVVTVPNPNNLVTNRPYVRVTGNEYFGRGMSYKDRSAYVIQGAA